MGRSKKMKGDPIGNGDLIRKAAEELDALENQLVEKRVATKETTDGKTAWRQRWVKQRVDPVILAEAVALTRRLEANPAKTTRHWRILMGYLKGLGFFEKLEPSLFADFEEQVTASAVSDAA